MVTQAQTTILIVDDDRVDVILAEKQIRKSNLQNPVVVAKDGIEAFEVLRGTNEKASLPKPYLILLDWNMPRMGGLEFITALRKDEQLKDSVVVVLSTSSDDSDIEAAQAHGVAAYIVKDRMNEEFFQIKQLLIG